MSTTKDVSPRAILAGAAAFAPAPTAGPALSAIADPDPIFAAIAAHRAAWAALCADCSRLDEAVLAGSPEAEAELEQLIDEHEDALFKPDDLPVVQSDQIREQPQDR
jgi:hypothetical protein